MLVLSRKIDEGLVIGDNIIIKVVSIDKGNVKLGIEAPKSTTILRSELKEQIENANKAASQAIDETLLNELRNFKK